jgi:dihydroorotase
MARASVRGRGKQPHYDLLLKGGHVIDPANNLNCAMDVAVSDGRIAAIERKVPANRADKTVNVSGLYVAPGLVDIHVHVAQGGAPTDWFSPSAPCHDRPLAIPADLMLQSGVTTVVDAGTAGCDTFRREKEETIDRSEIRVLAWLNIVANGMGGGKEQDLEQMSVERCAACIREYHDLIVGVKTAHYWTEKPCDSAHPPWEAVDRAVACGRATGLPVMVDFFPRPPVRPYADLILKKLRPGDIHTHVFAQQFPVIGRNGKVNPIMWEARKRGVVFDVGHGAASFWFRNAAPAVRQGFLPDSISTDLHSGSVVQLAVSMTNVMSKFLAMGETLPEVIRQSTVNPARQIHHPELGTLSVDSVADIAVFELQRGQFRFLDDGYARQKGREQLVARMTLRAGAIVHDPSGLSAVEWQKARRQYFYTPVVQGKKNASADDFPRRVAGPG